MQSARRLISTLLLGALAALAVPVAPAQSAGKPGKLIVPPRFKVAEHALVPARPPGSQTISYDITGSLAMRACFTSAWSDGKKVKCPKAARKACVDGRRLDVYARYAQVRRQAVTVERGGSFTATVAFEDDYQEVYLSVARKRARRNGIAITCFAGSTWIDISEANP